MPRHLVTWNDLRRRWRVGRASPTEADGRLMTWRTDATNRRADILERSGLVAPSWNLKISALCASACAAAISAVPSLHSQSAVLRTLPRTPRSQSAVRTRNTAVSAFLQTLPRTPRSQSAVRTRNPHSPANSASYRSTHQSCDLREKTARAGKQASTAEVEYGPRQKWGLDPDIDRDTRKVCEAS